MKTITLTIVSLLFNSLSVEAKTEKEKITDYDVVKIEKIITGHDVVEATINGQKGNFILDTGAVTVINDRLLEKYQLDNKLQTLEAAGAGGPIKVNFYAINSISIGNTDINIDQIGVTDLNQVLGGLYNASSIQLDGIIGQDVFIQGQSVLDVSQNTLTFPNIQNSSKESIASSLIDNSFTAIDLVTIGVKEYGFYFHGFNVEVNGVEKLLLLDSGASRTMLNKETLDLFGFGNENRTIGTTAGAGSTFSIESLQVSELSIDNKKVDISQIYAIDLSAFVGFVKTHTDLDVYGVIGQDILSPLKAIIDSSANKVYLKF